MINNALQQVVKILSREFRIDLVLGTVIHFYDDLKDLSQLNVDETIKRLRSFLYNALRDKDMLRVIEEKIADYLIKRPNALKDLIQDNLILYHTLHQAMLSNKIIRLRKEDVIKIESKLRKIRELVSYYYVPRSLKEIIDSWRIPAEWSDELMFRKLFVEDERISNMLSKVMELAMRGSNVLIVGEPGVGKTSLLYRALLELSKIKNIGLIIPGAQISNVHEELGITLFIDDLPQQPIDFQRLSRIRGIIATARLHDWLDLIKNYPELKQNFIELRLEAASEEFLEEMLTRLLTQYKIPYNENAVKIAVKKAMGAPMYIYQLVKDLLVIREREKNVKFDIPMAETIPAGMYEYVGELLRSAISNKPGGKAMIAALKCIALLRSKAINSIHLAMLYEFLCEKIGEKPNWDLYNDVHQLMIYDSKKMLLRIPHDVWVDVLQGKSRALNSITSLIDTKIPDRVKIEILKVTGEKTWIKIYEDTLYLIRKNLAKEQDIEKALAFARALKAEFPDIALHGLEEIENTTRTIIENA